MADRRNPYHYDPEYYVHGSTARKLDVAKQAEERDGGESRRSFGAQPAKRRGTGYERSRQASYAEPAKRRGTGYERSRQASYAEPAKRRGTGYERSRQASYAQPARRAEDYEQPARRKLPEREPDRYERIREQENKREQKKLFPISRSIGFFGIVLLCGSMLCMGVLCVRYLDLRAESTRLDKTIASLREELALLVDTNAGKEEALTENIDLDAIYQTAVGEFGMVFPNHNEVIYYDTADLSYVRQYADIPEAVNSILDALLP